MPRLLRIVYYLFLNLHSFLERDKYLESLLWPPPSFEEQAKPIFEKIGTEGERQTCKTVTLSFYATYKGIDIRILIGNQKLILAKTLKLPVNYK